MPPEAGAAEAESLSGAARRQYNRRLRREARQAEQAARRRRGLAARIFGIAVLVAAVGTAAWLVKDPIIESYQRQPISADASSTGATGQRQAGFPGQQFPDQGRAHIKRNDPRPTYNTTPPTSGPHWDDWPPYGIYDRPIADEHQVHHLEHGGIMVQYSCPSGCPELVEQLSSVVRRYRFKVILAPYDSPSMPARIALTAWTRLDAFDEFDENRILDFIEAYRNKGPESFPDSEADIKR